MRISSTVADLSADLAALGALGDQAMSESAARLAGAMRGPLTARLIEILGRVAAELDAGLPRGRVEVRLAGDDAELVFIDDEHAAGAEEPGPDGEADARITLRLSSALKGRIEAASSREGVSVNTWIVRALAQQSRSSQFKVGRRLTGYGRS